MAFQQDKKLPNGYSVRPLEMRLDDRKVFRKFKDWLTKGYLLPFTVERQAGMRYSQFSKRWKPNPTHQKYLLTGRRIKPGLWQMNVPEDHYEKVVLWLLETCQ